MLAETLISYAAGDLTGEGTVQGVFASADGRVAVVVDHTPFHPVDHTWPDQPGDQGRLAGASVEDTVIGAVSGGGDLLLGAEIPVRRGEPGWTWCVVHLVSAPACSPGDRVRLEVDAERRRRLSAAHTGCHVAALALNRAAARFWRKPARTDSLGAPDLDQLAMQRSTMDESGSIDVYRLGKSLRKKGFDSAGFLDDLEVVVADAEQTISAWIGSAAPVLVDDGGDRRLTAHREWTCGLLEGLARLPCGGTHLATLADLGGLRVTYEAGEEGSALTVRACPGACL